MTPQERLSATFSALADPTRRAILARLALGETSVTEIAKPFDMSLPAISKHLKVLETAGLIARGREAQSKVQMTGSSTIAASGKKVSIASTAT
jgi:DNA-binding transcriptional ArsR family regulator